MDFFDLMDMADYATRGASTAITVATVLGVIAALALAFFFARTKLRDRFLHSPSLLVLHDFLNFKKMWALWLLKLMYLILLCVITFNSFVLMFADSLGSGFGMLIFGNITLRVVYELLVVIFSIHENLNQVADKITGRQADPGADISAGMFFGDVGKQLKAGQEKIQARMEENRARQEAAQKLYEQQQEAQRQAAALPPAGPAVTPAPPPAATAATAKVCRHCGAALSGPGAFCPQCGQPV